MRYGYFDETPIVCYYQAGYADSMDKYIGSGKYGA